MEKRLKIIMDYYDLKDGVEEFLRKNEYLFNILVDIIEEINILFKDKKVFLDVYDDHEKLGSILYIVIVTSLPSEMNVRLHNTLMDGWFIFRFGETYGKLFPIVIGEDNEC